MQARLPGGSGLPEDVFENVVHYSVEEADAPTDLATAMQAFRDFYIVDGPGQSTFLGNYISETVQRTTDACEIRAYFQPDLTGVTPMGSPVGQLAFTMNPAATGSSLPEEVAAVISYNGDLSGVPVSITNPTPPPPTVRPQQRRRGRLYLGPLQANAGAEVTSEFRPSTAFRTDATAAFVTMAQAINALAQGETFGVWSKADAELYPAVAGYMDNAWDTQRRRGVDATTRTTFAI